MRAGFLTQKTKIKRPRARDRDHLRIDATTNKKENTMSTMFKVAIVAATILSTTSWALAQSRQQGEEEQWQPQRYSRTYAAPYQSHTQGRMYLRDRYVSPRATTR